MASLLELVGSMIQQFYCPLSHDWLTASSFELCQLIKRSEVTMRRTFAFDFMCGHFDFKGERLFLNNLWLDCPFSTEPIVLHSSKQNFQSFVYHLNNL